MSGHFSSGEKDCHVMRSRLVVVLARVTMKLDRFQTDPAPSRNREDDQAGGRFQERHVMRPPIDGCPTKVAPQRGIAVLFGLTSRTEARPKAPSQLARPERLGDKLLEVRVIYDKHFWYKSRARGTCLSEALAVAEPIHAAGAVRSISGTGSLGSPRHLPGLETLSPTAGPRSGCVLSRDGHVSTDEFRPQFRPLRYRRH